MGLRRQGRGRAKMPRKEIEPHTFLLSLNTDEELESPSLSLSLTHSLPPKSQGNLKSTRKARWSPFLSLYFWHKLIRRDQRQMRGKWSQNLPVPSHGTCFYTAAGGRTFHFLSLFRRDQDQLGEGHGLGEVWCHHRGGSKWADPF